MSENVQKMHKAKNWTSKTKELYGFKEVHQVEKWEIGGGMSNCHITYLEF